MLFSLAHANTTPSTSSRNHCHHSWVTIIRHQIIRRRQLQLSVARCLPDQCPAPPELFLHGLFWILRPCSTLLMPRCHAMALRWCHAQLNGSARRECVPSTVALSTPPAPPQRFHRFWGRTVPMQLPTVLLQGTNPSFSTSCALTTSVTQGTGFQRP